MQFQYTWTSPILNVQNSNWYEHLLFWMFKIVIAMYWQANSPKLDYINITLINSVLSKTFFIRC